MKRGLGVFLEDHDVDVTPSSSNVEVALSHATAMGSHDRPLKLPWESTPMMRDIFGVENLPWLEPLKVPRCLPQLTLPHASLAVSVGTKKKVIRQSCYLSCERSDDKERSAVLLRWVELIIMVPEGSTVGLQLLQREPKQEQNGLHFLIVSDSLRSRSTNTLKTRVASLALYVKWMIENHGDIPYLPFQEEHIYEYLCHLRNFCCAASRGSTLLSTLTFVGALLGMKGVSECTSSARCKGAALAMYLGKRPLRQAPPLTPVMICLLEIAAFCEADTYLRGLAGFALACIYGRLRVSDMNRLVHLSVKGRYGEGSLMRVKTSRTKEKQCTFLPVIIPTHGLLGINWFEAFMESRKFLGLEEVPTLESRSEDKSFGILPSSATVHLELYSKVSTSEISDGVRAILGKCMSEDEVKWITSHSLKTTLLTYLSRYGCDMVHSELLGYHLVQHRSAINYQRDALAAPIRFMMEMLGRIQNGEFRPSDVRDKLFPEPDDRLDIFGQVEDTLGFDFETIAETYLGVKVDSLGSLSDRDDELSYMYRLFCSEAGQVNPQVDPSCEGPDAQLIDLDVDSSDNDESPSSNSSDSASSSAEEALAVLSKEVWGTSGLRNISIYAVTDMLYRNRRTQVVHFGHCDFGDRTACGRSLGLNFLRFYGDADKAWPHCRHCWGNVDV